jgi:choline dehydrogenase-like flavoprotein
MLSEKVSSQDRGPDHIEDNIIIGSGPTGTACAAGLIERGQRVLMLDVGDRLPCDRQALVERLAASAKDAWDRTDVASLTKPLLEATETVRLKLAFGSDYPYRATSEVLDPTLDPALVGVRPSYAKGGLSTVWGAAVLPYLPRETADWPISRERLAPHYRRIAALIGATGDDDRLSTLFEIADGGSRAPLSAQAGALLARAERQARPLAEAGVHIGHSRLALAGDCVRCAMCLYGCPYGVIFNSARLVERFRREHAEFRYRDGVQALRFAESENAVRVEARDLRSGAIEQIFARRLFIAAGVLSTALLTLRSLPLPLPLRLRDSQYFLIPLLSLTRLAAKPQHDPQHTLAQLFCEILDPAVSPYSVHLQLYTWNELFAAEIKRKLGPAAGVAGGLAERISTRMLLIQGYLHSAASSAIALSLEGAGGDARLALRPIVNPAVDGQIRAVGRKLFSLIRRTLLLPLMPLASIEAPGRGYHCGASLPMNAAPGPGETTVLGQPGGLRRVHIVDATVLPSIPAATITLTAMANAHRIAAEA